MIPTTVSTGRVARVLAFTCVAACAATSSDPDGDPARGGTSGSAAPAAGSGGHADATPAPTAGSGGQATASGGTSAGGASGGGGDAMVMAGNAGTSVSAPGGAGGTPPVADDCADANVTRDDLLLWLRADRDVTTETDDRVTRWQDASADKRIATAASANVRPQRVANAVHGKPVIRFDGMDDIMQVDVPVDGRTTLSIALVTATTRLWMSDPGEWCGKASENGCSNTYNGPLTWDETGAWGMVHVYPVQTQVAYRFGNGESRMVPEADIKPTYRRPMSIGNAFTRTLAVHDNARNIIFVDGQQVHSSNAPNGVPAIKNTAAQARIGSGRFDKRWQGDIAEILVWGRALDEGARAALDRYLACRYTRS